MTHARTHTHFASQVWHYDKRGSSGSQPDGSGERGGASSAAAAAAVAAVAEAGAGVCVYVCVSVCVCLVYICA